MWAQTYAPIAGSLALSSLVAALPIFTLLYCLGLRRLPAWKSALLGVGCALAVAVFGYRMPPQLALSAVAYGAAFGLFPIGWIVFTAILLYRITVETGNFQIIKDSLGSLTADPRLQALLVAFAFGAFIEGAAGFGTPVAVAAAMLAGLGFPRFHAAGICLLANTAPVAFGSIGTPVITLATVTDLPLEKLSAAVGRICAPVSFFVPAYLIAVMGGWNAVRAVLPAVAACGLSFAGTQLLVSNFLGPQLTDILSSLAAILSLLLLMSLWKPADSPVSGEHLAPPSVAERPPASQVLRAWSPYLVLVLLVLLWGFYKTTLNRPSIIFEWPGLDRKILQFPPAVQAPLPARAVFRFEWLATSGTACLLACLVSAAILGLPLTGFLRLLARTFNQMLLSLVTIACVLGLAFLMNYSGATVTLGLAFATTGPLFPFFSALLGWLGVFLTGSNTSSNALFGNLQVVTANQLHLNPILMAASNSSGGVMGKMISLQSIAVAAAATGMPPSEEGKLFRFTFRHSILLASAMGLVTVFYAFVRPQWAP